MAALYDLMLMLDADAPTERRAEILSGVESAIQSSGSIEGTHDWGVRNLAYQIDHRSDADYRLLQFSGPPELLENLTRTLRVTDGVLRFRLIKMKPGTPPPPTVRPEPPRVAEAAAPVAEVAAADAGDAAVEEAPAEEAAAAPEPAPAEAAPAETTAAPEPASEGEAADADAAPAETPG